MASSDKHLVLEIEVPCMYTADIDGLREFKSEDTPESDFILNCIGEPGIVRVRMEISGEKDSDVVEVWGLVREAKLVEPSRGYEVGGMLADAQLAEHGGHRLMRDDHACDWCRYDEPEVTD